MLARVFRPSVRYFSTIPTPFHLELDVNSQPKTKPIPVTYENAILAAEWVPRSLREGLGALPDPLKAFAHVEIANYPLPIYTTEKLEVDNAVIQEALVQPKEDHVSPLTEFGILPVSVFGAAALIANEIFLVNEEAMLIGTFGVFLFTMYTQVGASISAEFGAQATQAKVMHEQAIDSQLVAVDGLIAALKERVDLVKKLESNYVVQENLSQRFKEMLVHKYKRIFFEVLDEKLQILKKKEQEAITSLNLELIKFVTKTVGNIFASDKELRDGVLRSVLELLARGKEGEGKIESPVAGAYELALSYARFELETKRIKDFEITDAQRNRVYRALKAAADADERPLDPIDTLVPKRVKLPSFSRVIA